MPTLTSIRVRNYLGAGNDAAGAELGGKHAVFCGPNGSGKTTMLSAASLFSTVGINLVQPGPAVGEFVLSSLADGAATADLFHMDAPESQIEIGFQAPVEFSPVLTLLQEHKLLSGSPAYVRCFLSLRPNQKTLTSLRINDVDIFEAAVQRDYLARLPSANDQQIRYGTRVPAFIGLPNLLAQLLNSLADRIVYFPSLRRIESGQANALTVLAAGLGIVDWVRRASRASSENYQSRQEFQHLREFESEFSSFADFDNLRLSVSETNTTINAEINKHLRPLSRLGSGIGECLLILLVAKLSRLGQLATPKDVFLLEEPELHLHPTLQRKLIDNLCRNVGQLVVSTHSPTTVNEIQAHGGSVFRTGLQDGATQIHEVKTGLDLLKTLAGIGVSAGDILQAHKVLWVEGPTDIPVFKKWLFTNPKRSSQNVAVVHLGGAAMFSANVNPTDLVNLNPNALVIIDSEKASVTAPVETRRLTFQSKCVAANLDCRIAERRATENYLSSRALTEVYGSSIVSVDPFRDLLSQGVAQFTKGRNDEVAQHLTWEDIVGTDIGDAIDAFLQG